MFPKARDRKSIIASAVILIFAIVMLFSALTIKSGAELGRGADFLPRIMSVMLIGCSVLLFVFPDPPKKEAAESPVHKGAWIGLVKSFALLFMYIYLLKPVGFFITTSAYIFLQSWMITPIGKFNPVKLAVISLLSAGITYCVFAYLLQLMLPAGILG